MLKLTEGETPGTAATTPRLSLGRLCEAETQTEPLLLQQMSQTEAATFLTTPPGGLLNSPGAFNTTRSSGYLSREPSLSRESSNSINNNILPGHGYPSRDTSAASTPRTRRLSFLPRESSTASLNGNKNVSSACDCLGCPGNPRVGAPSFQRNSCHDTDDATDALGGQLEDPEDYLDTLDRKVTEIMNRDSSRRSSYNDLAASKRTEDMYGPLSLSYGRKKSAVASGGGSDLNCNPTTVYGGGGRVPEGVIRFEDDDGKASSSEEAMDSSQEDLSQIWSDEDSDHYVLRRRRYVRL